MDYTSATEIEEHVVVLTEPGERYVAHFTPQSGKALDLLNELYSTHLQFGGRVKVLGCDGTAVNTGTAGGLCRLFELVAGAPVHWFVCQLHAQLNAVPFIARGSTEHDAVVSVTEPAVSTSLRRPGSWVAVSRRRTPALPLHHRHLAPSAPAEC